LSWQARSRDIASAQEDQSSSRASAEQSGQQQRMPMISLTENPVF
jgi:hypothetical protein